MIKTTFFALMLSVGLAGAAGAQYLGSAVQSGDTTHFYGSGATNFPTVNFDWLGDLPDKARAARAREAATRALEAEARAREAEARAREAEARAREARARQRNQGQTVRSPAQP
jgi:hypothetical protein